MRAFFALPVPESVAAKLQTLVPPIRQVRRVRAANLHLTLHFLQDAPVTLADDLRLTNLPPAFTLIPSRVILLPEAGPIRIIAASLAAPHAALHQLHAAIAADLHRLGLPTDNRRYLPHITLARADPPLPQQVRGNTPMEPRVDVTFPAAALHLIESRPTDNGFAYATLRTWPLA